MLSQMCSIFNKFYVTNSSSLIKETCQISWNAWEYAYSFRADWYTHSILPFKQGSLRPKQNNSTYLSSDRVIILRKQIKNAYNSIPEFTFDHVTSQLISKEQQKVSY